MYALTLYTFVATLLVGLAHRFVTRISLQTALLLAFLPLCFTGKALLTGQVYAPIDLPFQAEPLKAVAGQYGIGVARSGILSDIYCQIIPWKKAVRHAFDRGEWPLWNPFILCGDILAAAGQPAVYDPINVFGYLIPLPDALTYEATAVHLLSALCMFLFLRELGCREGAALVGAAGWSFCGFLVFLTLWPVGHATAVFPLVLLGVRRVIRGPGLANAALLATAFSLLLLAGHPETALHVVAVSAIYALFEIWALFEVGAVGGARLFRVVASGVAAGLLALAVAAIHLLPFLEALPQTAEYPFRRAVYTQMGRGIPVTETLARIQWHLLPVTVAESPTFVPFHAYAGTVVLGLAIFGLLAAASRIRWLLLAMGIFGLLLGTELDGLSDWLAKIPLFDVALNERLIFVAAFSLCALAGLGAEAWACCGKSVPLAAIFGALLLAAAVPLWMSTGARLSPPIGFATGGFGFSAATWLGLVPCAILGVLAACRVSPAVAARLVAPAVLVLLILQRMVEIGGLYPTLPRAAFYPPAPPLTAIPRHFPPYRFVSQGFTMIPNGATMYELEDVRGYQAMKLRRLVETMSLWSIEQGVWFNRVDRLDPFLSFLGVRYAFIGGSDSSHPRGWRTFAASEAGIVYENPRALDRVFVPDRVCLGLSTESILWEMRRERHFARRAWISGEAVPYGYPREESNGPGNVVVEAATGSRYQIRTDMENAGWMVATESAWKGWVATVDGKRVPLAYANHAFLAVHVPQGRHRVELAYWPLSFVIGRGITVAALGGILAIGLFCWRRRRAEAPLSHS